jgi:OOP family OmpA-OmpF porin
MTHRFDPPSARRLSAAAIAAALAVCAGGALAQQSSGYVVDSAKNPVRSASGDCVRPGQGAAPASEPCPPAASATSDSRVAAAPAAAAPAAAGATTPSTTTTAASGATARGLPGYVVSSDGNVVLSGFGQCVRAGHWVPANAAEPCDRMARADVPAPVAVVQPAPVAKAEPAPAPVAAPEPPRPVIQKLTLSTDVLFDFNKAELKDAGKERLDQLAEEIKDARVDEIVATGHADRIASDDYNQKLSEQRAQAVREYLASKVEDPNRVTAEGKGESQPVTGDECKKLGAERASNRKLVQCLQPDRRVEIEVLGSREVAGTPGSPASGSTAGSGSSAPR